MSDNRDKWKNWALLWLPFMRPPHHNHYDLLNFHWHLPYTLIISATNYTHGAISYLKQSHDEFHWPTVEDNSADGRCSRQCWVVSKSLERGCSVRIHCPWCFFIEPNWSKDEKLHTNCDISMDNHTANIPQLGVDHINSIQIENTWNYHSEKISINIFAIEEHLNEILYPKKVIFLAKNSLDKHPRDLNWMWSWNREDKCAKLFFLLFNQERRWKKHTAQEFILICRQTRIELHTLKTDHSTRDHFKNWTGRSRNLRSCWRLVHLPATAASHVHIFRKIWSCVSCCWLVFIEKAGECAKIVDVWSLLAQYRAKNTKLRTEETFLRRAF